MPLLRWLRRSPWIILTAATIAALGAAFLLAQWQAEQRWQNYATAARQRGVKFSLAEFEQPAVDPAQNFAEIPLLQAAFTSGGAKTVFQLPEITRKAPDPRNRLRGEPTDWPAWQKAFQTAGMLADLSGDPVRDVLRSLDHYAPQIQQWQEGSQRPFCRFPLDFKAGLDMPVHHLSTFSDAAKLFYLRMKAHLALGESKAALEDFHDSLQIVRSLAAEPSFIAALVRMGTMMPTRPLGEGLAKGLWAEPQLKQIQTELGALEIWQDFRFTLRSQHAAVNASFEAAANASLSKRAAIIRPQLHDIDIPGTSISIPADVAALLVPAKLIRDNQLRHSRYFEEMLARIAADNTGINLDGPTPSSPEYITAPLEQQYFGLFSELADTYGSIESRYLRLCTARNQALLACALERFKLARGNYPEALAELAPEFCQKLPADPYSGAALHYQRTPAGSFTLYSVGKNRKDDAARLDETKLESDQADAVWLYAPQGKL